MIFFFPLNIVGSYKKIKKIKIKMKKLETQIKNIRFCFGGPKLFVARREIVIDKFEFRFKLLM